MFSFSSNFVPRTTSTVTHKSNLLVEHYLFLLVKMSRFTNINHDRTRLHRPTNLKLAERLSQCKPKVSDLDHNARYPMAPKDIIVMSHELLGRKEYAVDCTSPQQARL